MVASHSHFAAYIVNSVWLGPFHRSATQTFCIFAGIWLFVSASFLGPLGKAVPEGARRGGFGLDVPAGTVLYKRLVEHSKSIMQASNLEIKDFHCRYLVVDDVWIPLGESLLITTFAPVWNRVLDGFGNHTPGKGRYSQQRSPWDVIHPGRAWAMQCAENQRPEAEILKTLTTYIDEAYGTD